MGAGHSHSHRADRGTRDAVVVPPGRRRVLLALLALVAAATVVGLVALWPDQGKVDEVGKDVSFNAPGVSFALGRIESVLPACPQGGSDGGATAAGGNCGQARVTVVDGSGKGDQARIDLPPQVSESGLAAGDEVRLTRRASAGQPATYSYFGTERTSTLWILAALFVVVVIAVAWQRGLFALIGLAFSGWVIVSFVLPGVLSGEPALLVGLVACSAIMFVVLYTTHGFSIRTSVALAGTLVGVGLTALIGVWAVQSSHLSGIGDEGGGVLQGFAVSLDFQGLLAAAVMIAGLGVLNDVTITQASAVWELRGASATMGRLDLMRSGMRIGRDHIASTIYTIAFAYAGTALTLLLVLQLYDLPVVELLSTEEIAQEVVRILATSIGLVLAVPLTTAIAAALVPGAQGADPDLEVSAL
jgi:uncharacterized membrane protein